jgi:hypothetical protein
VVLGVSLFFFSFFLFFGLKEKRTNTHTPIAIHAMCTRWKGEKKKEEENEGIIAVGLLLLFGPNRSNQETVTG